MFESGLAGDEPRANAPLAPPKRIIARGFKWGLALMAAASASVLVWGVFDNFQEAADRTH